jgi:hypothetical protein
MLTYLTLVSSVAVLSAGCKKRDHLVPASAIVYAASHLQPGQGLLREELTGPSAGAW